MGSKRIYTCDACGRTGEWGPGWSWFGSEHRRGAPYWHGPFIERIVCSAKCRGGEPLLDEGDR